MAVLSINTLSLAPAPLPAQMKIVARLGAEGISPDLPQIDAIGAALVRRLLRDNGLTLATLTHRAFAFATPEEADKGRERLLRTIGIAHELDAASITLTTGGRGSQTWRDAAERFAEAIAPCAQVAREAGVTLGIEPTSHLYADASIVHRLTDTAALAQKAGIGVTIDLFACWVDADIDQGLAMAAPLAKVVQVSDYVAGDRALPCRALPGDGIIPLPRIVSALRAAGFDGWYDLEVIGPRLAAEGHEPGLCRALSTMRRWLGERITA